MFNISFFEIIIFLILALFFIRPKDLPEIARFIGKTIYRIKNFYHNSKDIISNLSRDFGIDDLKQEISQGISQEKSKIEDDVTIIVDMDGNEHKVNNIKELRKDLSEDELNSEILKQNNNNNKSSS
jgi:sec-independent protein translocase protein TatB